MSLSELGYFMPGWCSVFLKGLLKKPPSLEGGLYLCIFSCCS